MTTDTTKIAIDHWLYKIIPFGKENVKWYNWPLWAFFGNDNDGIFGERSEFFFPAWNDSKTTPWVAVKWWFRNPFHNFVRFTLERKHDTQYYVAQYTSENGWKFLFRDKADLWNTENKQISLSVDPFLVAARGLLGFEMYLGWKPDGAFGAAFRVTNSTRG